MQFGYFDENRKEYVITKPNTPQPWANYLGSPAYGALISNNAGGYSFEKSGANGRILRYVFNSFDQPGRYIYLRDNDSKDFWSNSWQPVAKPLDSFKSEVRHGTAYTKIASDYAGSQVLLYDSEYDLSVKFQPGSGLVFYYKGSYMQMTPDNTVTIHYGPDETTGVQIQLTDGKIYIQAPQQINITSGNEVNIEGKVITLNGESAVRIKGTTPNTCAVNATQLITLLQTMATNIDTKLGQSKSGICAAAVSGSKEKIMNQHILYI